MLKKNSFIGQKAGSDKNLTSLTPNNQVWGGSFHEYRTGIGGRRVLKHNMQKVDKKKMMNTNFCMYFLENVASKKIKEIKSNEVNMNLVELGTETKETTLPNQGHIRSIKSNHNAEIQVSNIEKELERCLEYNENGQNKLTKILIKG